METESHDATYIPESIIPGQKTAERTALYSKHYAIGQDNAREHLRRWLAREDIAWCPCLGCRGGKPRVEEMR